MSNLKNLTNQRFGRVYVISRADNKKSWTMWNCICDCGVEFITYSTHLIRGNIKSCGCLLNRSGDHHVSWKGYGEISGRRWSAIKRTALSTRKCRLNTTFEITIEYAWELFLTQKRKCSLSGIELKFNSTESSETTASLDRIDSSKGYIVGNVQWVHKDINRMKNIFDQSYFIEVCKRIAEYR